jgi:hypothetical protein
MTTDSEQAARKLQDTRRQKATSAAKSLRAAKQRRVTELLREIRTGTEALSAGADRLLERLS